MSKEDDLDRELAFHMEQEIAARVAAGMSADEARRQAVQSFGHREQIKEECRDVHRSALLDNFRRDAKYAVRSLRKNPGATLLAILILALGIGANTAIFTVVNAILLRPLPFPAADRIFSVRVMRFASRRRWKLWRRGAAPPITPVTTRARWSISREREARCGSPPVPHPPGSSP